MKTLIPILIIIVLAFAAGYFYHKSAPNPSPQQLTLEQILSIKELHLVKHTFIAGQNLIFCHWSVLSPTKKSDGEKSMVKTPTIGKIRLCYRQGDCLPCWHRSGFAPLKGYQGTLNLLQSFL